MVADSAPVEVHRASPRGFEQAYWHEGVGGAGPIVLVHGWPESKRIFARVVEPLVDAGFEVVVPDLRGFGDSEVGDRYGDVAAHSRDVHALVHDVLGHREAVLVGGDLGGPVIQDLALRFPGSCRRMVLFNSPLPYVKEAMAGMRTRPPMEAADYFLRQGTDADALAAELRTPEERRRYIATFYTSRFWGHPGSFTPADVDFHTEPFGDGDKLRATFRTYESAFSPDARSEDALLAVNPDVRCVVLFGTSDHVLYPDFDRMAAVVFPDHVGPFLLRDCGHFVPWEAPHALASTIVAFCGGR
jgi:pimeloyl-ACP methyl ester carboxylesterase